MPVKGILLDHLVHDVKKDSIQEEMKISRLLPPSNVGGALLGGSSSYIEKGPRL